MGDRKEPTPVPTDQVKPDPPHPPPRKITDQPELSYERVRNIIGGLPPRQDPEQMGRVLSVDVVDDGKLTVVIATENARALLEQFGQGLSIPVYFRPVSVETEPDRCECCEGTEDVRFRPDADVDLCDSCYLQLLQDYAANVAIQDRGALERMGQDRAWLVDLLMDMRTGDCWCDMGIGNPMLSKHTVRCERIRNLVLLANVDGPPSPGQHAVDQEGFLYRCTQRQRSGKGNHGEPKYGGPCSRRLERCIQCVIEQAIEDLSSAAILNRADGQQRVAFDCDCEQGPTVSDPACHADDCDYRKRVSV